MASHPFATRGRSGRQKGGVYRYGWRARSREGGPNNGQKPRFGVHAPTIMST